MLFFSRSKRTKSGSTREHLRNAMYRSAYASFDDAISERSNGLASSYRG